MNAPQSRSKVAFVPSAVVRGPAPSSHVLSAPLLPSKVGAFRNSSPLPPSFVIGYSSAQSTRKSPQFDSPAPMCADAPISPRRARAPRPSTRTRSALSTCTTPHRNAPLRQRTPRTTHHVSILDPRPSASKGGGIWEFTAATSSLHAEPPVDAKNREKPPHSARISVPPRTQNAALGLLRSADAARTRNDSLALSNRVTSALR